MRHGTVLAASSLVVVACLLAVAGLFSRPAEAQTPPASQPPVEPPRVPPPDVPRKEAFRGMSIDQLVEQVKVLRAQRAELEKREQEAVTVLKERLKEQRQRLKQLGISLEESEPTPHQADLVPGSRPPSPK